MGYVCAKVLRLDADTICKRKSRLRRKIPYTSEKYKPSDKSSQSMPSIPRPRSRNLSQSSNNSESSIQSPPPPPPPPTSSTPTQLAPISKIPRPPPASQTFASFEQSSSAPVQQTPSQAQEIDLCTFSSDSHENEFSHFTGPNSTSATPSQGFDIDIDTDSAPFSAGPLPTREQLKEQHEAEISDKVRAALEFKQELDDNNRREAEELETAKLKHDGNLTVWASNNKEKRNVRTLLSTMHTVLWSGHSWKPLSLGDLLAAKQVKLAYRKAMLVVHPDRCSALSAEVRFIAKRVFEAINEAWQEFLKKEGDGL